MFGSIFGSLGEAVKNVGRIASAPVEIAADITAAVVEPVAGIAQDAVDMVKDLTGRDKA